MSGICSAHQDHDPDCELCNPNPKSDGPPTSPDPNEVIGGWPLNIGRGELKAIRREEHLCENCFHCGLCVVDAAIREEMLVVVSRCGTFVPTPE